MLDRRLLIVGGKGGVGRSTVTAAIGVRAAEAGWRTLLVELTGQTDVARLFGASSPAGLAEIELAPDLFHVTVEREAVLEDYLRHEVPGPLPAGRVARSRTFRMFVDAAPGMGELLAIGKVWELARPRRGRRGPRSYDLVILDGPASGQLAALTGAPHTFRAIARMGPIAKQTANIEELLRDTERTGFLAVATPEQMAVSETLALDATLSESLGRGFDAVLVNKLVTVPFGSAAERTWSAVPAEPALASARWLLERAQAQREEADRLEQGLPTLPVSQLPFVFDELDRPRLEELAGRLRLT